MMRSPLSDQMMIVLYGSKGGDQRGRQGQPSHPGEGRAHPSLPELAKVSPPGILTMQRTASV